MLCHGSDVGSFPHSNGVRTTLDSLRVRGIYQKHPVNHGTPSISISLYIDVHVCVCFLVWL